MEVAVYKLLDFLWISFYVFAQRGVVEGAELGDDAVDHGGREDVVLLEDGTLTVETVGRGYARVGKLCEGGQTVGILGSVDVDIDVGVFGYLKGVLHLEAVAAGDAESCEQLVEVGAAVGRAHLNGLLDAGVVACLGLQGIGFVAHVHISSPSQGHADKDGAVAVAPADVGGCLLMGDETEVGGGILVAEGGDGGCKVHHAGNHLTCTL